ncbi:MAG: PorT family protein [Prevotella sp.]|nr:PorT family protein [Prevotella sp.]
MKKILTTFLFLCLFTLACQAQFRYGIKGGANFSNYTGDNIGDFMDKNMTLFFIGPSAEFFLIGPLGLEASLLYVQRGIKLKADDKKYKRSYIELPVNLKYRFASIGLARPYLVAGPYIDFKISGKDKFGDIKDNVDTQWKAKSFGAGINIGGGVELLRILQVGVNYGLGLTENYKASDGKYAVKENILSVTAGVYF